MEAARLIRAASRTFTLALRNRLNAATSVACAPLLPSESPSKAKALRRGLPQRGGRLLLASCAAAAALVGALCVLTLGGLVLTRRGRRDVPLASLADYPEVMVETSAPFKDINRAQLALKAVEGAGKAPVRRRSAGRVPSVTFTSSPPGLSTEGYPDLRVIVLTMDRKESLARLFRSLAAADYGGRRVDLDIWIDRLDGPLDDSEELMNSMLKLCDTFVWHFGVRSVHARTRNAGLYEQWIYTWDADAESKEMAVILEDDLAVSPHFYTWLRRAREEYASDPNVAAFTLQRGDLRPRQVRGVATGKLKVDPSIPVYKYRLLGTWGFAPERAAWVEFREWYEEMRKKDEKPYVSGLMTTDWYKSQEKAAEAKGLTVATTMWSQWFIKFADMKDKFTVYANLPDGTTLASNFREAGMHYSDKPRSADFAVFNSSADVFSFPKDVPYLDWDGRTLKMPEVDISSSFRFSS